jgi:hypothetical protein
LRRKRRLLRQGRTVRLQWLLLLLLLLWMCGLACGATIGPCWLRTLLLLLLFRQR